MAYTTKKTNNSVKTANTIKKAVVKDTIETVSSVKESPTEIPVIEPVKEERVYTDEDLIPCRSIVSGRLFIEGTRSKLLYTWADYGDVVDVEYRDLVYLVRTHNDKSIYSPRIIVEDEDFINQNSKLKDFYDSLYTHSDLMSILSLSVKDMIETIKTLPLGAKESIKGITATMIQNGNLDSIQRIKALDELFGTNMFLTLAVE